MRQWLLVGMHFVGFCPDTAEYGHRSHDVAPGKSGIVLLDNKIIIPTDYTGDEYVLGLKSMGPYDGLFQQRQRRVMDGTVGKVTHFVNHSMLGTT